MSSHENQNSMINVGIDVSKAMLEVAIRPNGERISLPNDESGHQALIERLRGVRPQRIVLEPTGGFELAIVQALVVADLPVVVVNARQMRQFAQAVGRLAKTDRIDADVIAHFAEAIQPQIRELPGEDQRQLEALITRRRQLVDIRSSEIKRKQTAPKVIHPNRNVNPAIKAFYTRLIASGKPKMVAIVAAMRKLLTTLNAMIRSGQRWNPNLLEA